MPEGGWDPCREQKRLPLADTFLHDNLADVAYQPGEDGRLSGGCRPALESGAEVEGSAEEIEFDAINRVIFQDLADDLHEARFDIRMFEIDQAPETSAIVVFFCLGQRGHDASGISLFPLGTKLWGEGVMNVVHPQRPDRFHSVFAGKLAGHPQAVRIPCQELGQIVVGKRAGLGKKNLGHLGLVGEEVEALGGRVEDAVDMGAQQRRVP